MVDKTLRANIVGVQDRLYQVAGIGTQVYSQTTIQNKLVDAFDMIFTDQWWKRFMTRSTGTLDGTTGEITGTFPFASYDDVYRIFPENFDIPLRRLPLEYNQALRSQGGFPRFYEYSPTVGKLVTCYPIDATGTITIIGRVHPGEFALNTVMPFDHLALQYKAAWDWAVDDGANEAQATKLQNLYNTRIQQIERAQSNDPIPLNGVSGGYPTTWHETQ